MWISPVIIHGNIIFLSFSFNLLKTSYASSDVLYLPMNLFWQPFLQEIILKTKGGNFFRPGFFKITIFLNLNYNDGLKRIETRTFKDRLDLETNTFHQEVSMGYQKVLEKLVKNLIKSVR